MPFIIKMVMTSLTTTTKIMTYTVVGDDDYVDADGDDEI